MCSNYGTVLCIRFAFVTGEDLCQSFRGDTLFTIQAPTGTRLELPPPDASVLISFVDHCCLFIIGSHI